MQSSSDFPLPENLPRPVDDGRAKHLLGVPMPRLSLPSTAGDLVCLSKFPATTTVLFCYPRTGVPGEPLPHGWDLIPGARGCTPQTCGFRDLHSEFAKRNVAVYGISTQESDYQKEMAQRLHLPFDILSDWEFRLCDALDLPTFEVEGMRLMKRLTLIVRAGRVAWVLYPIFPPNENAKEVLQWLESNPA